MIAKRSLSDRDNEDTNSVPVETVQKTYTRKNVMRSAYLIIDAGDDFNRRDLLPDRQTNIVEVGTGFIKRFFDNSPLGNLGLVVTREGIAERICGLQVSGDEIITKFKKALTQTGGSGSPSLQNAITMAMTELNEQPPLSLRELIIIWNTMGTSDRGDIYDTISTLADSEIKCTILGIGGHVQILSLLASKTSGEYVVPKHESHFKELFYGFANPSDVKINAGQAVKTSLIPMGFPKATVDQLSGNLFYECPQCSEEVRTLPCLCQTCRITLSSSSHVSRSYFSLFPPPPAVGAIASSTIKISCPACNQLTTKTLTCSECTSQFCQHCFEFMQNTLHYCIGCQ